MNYHDLFAYNEATGDLVWKNRPLDHFAHAQAYGRWNTLFAGKVAGRRHHIRNGEASAVIIGIGGKLHKAHNIIWEMKKGAIPSGMVVDHADINPFNNAWVNLRLANRSQNSFNTKRLPTKKTGVRGVYPMRGCKGRYMAAIRKDGRLIHLGSYGSIEAAAAARRDAEKRFFGEFAQCA